MRIASSVISLICLVLTTGSCDATTKPTIEFPKPVVITEGNILEYQSGTINRTWKEGDTITFNFYDGTLFVNGLVHYPHPWVMKDEASLAKQYGRVPYVLTHYNGDVFYPWNNAVKDYEENKQATTRAAEEAYVATHKIEAARDVLVNSGLFKNITVTTISDLPALSYEYVGLESADGSFTYLPLREVLPPVATSPPPLTLTQASNIAWQIIRYITDSKFANQITLREGNIEVNVVSQRIAKGGK